MRQMVSCNSLKTLNPTDGSRWMLSDPFYNEDQPEL